MADLAKRLTEINGRADRCRCKYCGGALEVRKVFFGDIETARTEIFCQKCDRIEYGVEPEIYTIASYYVKAFRFNCFPDLEADERTDRLNIARVCEIITWYSQALGILEAKGFTDDIQPLLANKTTLLLANEVLEEC